MIATNNHWERQEQCVVVFDPFFDEMESWIEAQYRLELIRESIETMVYLGRTWTAIKFHMFKKGATFFLRAMFSKGGWIPKKIRKIRKNR